MHDNHQCLIRLKPNFINQELKVLILHYINKSVNVEINSINKMINTFKFEYLHLKNNNHMQ